MFDWNDLITKVKAASYQTGYATSRMSAERTFYRLDFLPMSCPRQAPQRHLLCQADIQEELSRQRISHLYEPFVAAKC